MVFVGSGAEADYAGKAVAGKIVLAETSYHPARHEKILREGYEAMAKHPEIVGYVPWALMDVRVPMHWRWYNRGSGTFAYGLMDNNYQKKAVFPVVQECIHDMRKQYGDL